VSSRIAILLLFVAAFDTLPSALAHDGPARPSAGRPAACTHERSEFMHERSEFDGGHEIDQHDWPVGV